MVEELRNRVEEMIRRHLQFARSWHYLRVRWTFNIMLHIFNQRYRLGCPSSWLTTSGS